MESKFDYQTKVLKATSGRRRAAMFLLEVAMQLCQREVESLLFETVSAEVSVWTSGASNAWGGPRNGNAAHALLDM